MLSRKVLNEGLKRLELAEALKVARKKAATERKLAAEECKQAKQVREQQWRFDLDAYTDQVTACREQVASLEAEWKEHRDQAPIDHKRLPKKPELPIRPKRPLKTKSFFFFFFFKSVLAYGLDHGETHAAIGAPL